jgi:hypothetical protein
MKRRLVWLLALAGLAWLWLRSGGRRPRPAVHAPAGADPADELRRKLGESKGRDAASAEQDAPEGAAEPQAGPAGPGADASEDVEARRREIHERARSATEEMRRSGAD